MAISGNGIPNSSCSTQAVRSAGDSVSSTTINAKLTRSSRLTRSAGSSRIGSGSHGPTYDSRCTRAERSTSSARRDTATTAQPATSRTGSRASACASRSQQSETTSSASALVPSTAYAIPTRRGRTALYAAASSGPLAHRLGSIVSR